MKLTNSIFLAAFLFSATAVANNQTIAVVKTAETESAGELTMPKSLLGKWVLDIKASNQLATEKTNSDAKFADMMPKIIELSKKVSYELTPTTITMSNGEKSLEIDITLYQRNNNELMFEISKGEQKDHLVIKFLNKDTIQVLDKQFLGSDYLAWKRGKN
ncbi:hypothetical protein [Biformimicrobium ophioploci]|uniref:Uncharacterized protein n=1 Tax=Biformimicrobium ophioploci TaxID=3036711 RepID=A0ABQ6LXR2_9GAMM|nr:hypothetical protein [Microbulbifer sp. NKW57]GMG86840.1 hypothetical protein MNKW57_11610 [Microbulbifer sp. NKW57]